MVDISPSADDLGPNDEDDLTSSPTAGPKPTSPKARPMPTATAPPRGAVADALPYHTSAAHPVTGNSLRAWITIGVTAAVVIVVILGIALRIPTDQFAAYMAPLLVLAGTVLGYWFGSDKS